MLVIPLGSGYKKFVYEFNPPPVGATGVLGHNPAEWELQLGAYLRCPEPGITQIGPMEGGFMFSKLRLNPAYPIKLNCILMGYPDPPDGTGIYAGVALHGDPITDQNYFSLGLSLPVPQLGTQEGRIVWLKNEGIWTPVQSYRALEWYELELAWQPIGGHIEGWVNGSCRISQDGFTWVDDPCIWIGGGHNPNGDSRKGVIAFAGLEVTGVPVAGTV